MTPGELIAAKYRLTRPIGDGSMGLVWAASEAGTGREVAVKLIQRQTPEAKRRLVREARVCRTLAHPNIVEVLDAGEMPDGMPFLIMELLVGESLAQRLKRERRPPREAAVGIVLAVARALSAAHAVGVVHRDLKPANIFLHKDPVTGVEVVKVVDFGISKMSVDDQSASTAQNAILGSPAYMSPEQARGGSKHVDGRADLWSLGVVLFEMLAGRRPFQSKAIYAAISEILSAPIPSLASVAPDVDPGLGHVVDRCLQRDVGERIASAELVIEMLSPFASSSASPIDLPPSPAPKPLARPVMIGEPSQPPTRPAASPPLIEEESHEPQTMPIDLSRFGALPAPAKMGEPPQPPARPAASPPLIEEESHELQTMPLDLKPLAPAPTRPRPPAPAPAPPAPDPEDLLPTTEMPNPLLLAPAGKGITAPFTPAIVPRMPVPAPEPEVSTFPLPTLPLPTAPSRERKVMVTLVIGLAVLALVLWALVMMYAC